MKPEKAVGKSSGKLTVYFEEPFWVGIFEETADGKLSVARVVFGSEPKDSFVLEFIEKNYFKLKFSPELIFEEKKSADNPKRRQREAKKQISEKGIGTKSQQAISKMREEGKIEHKLMSKEQREAEAKRQFELKKQKRKEKRRGH